MQLEEGEIESDNESIESYTAIPLDPYTPLERPDFGPLNQVPPKEEEIESDRKDSSSENSEDELGPKRAKLRRINPSTKKNKYRIWCKDPNEHLTDFLDSFGMRNPENDRNVENYTVPNSVIFERKRKMPHRRLAENHEKLTPLEIAALETTELNSFDEVAKDIAAKLSEPNYDLILRIVVIIGKDKAIAYYNKTREIEKDGGLLIANQSRRRTSGGVFIMLVRCSKNIPKSQKNEIFKDSRLESQARKSLMKKKYRKKKYHDWLSQMGDEKEVESGHEVMNNPPPSPEPQPPENLPDLPLRQDIVSYGDLNLTPPDSVEPELLNESDKIDSSPEYNTSPKKSYKPPKKQGMEDFDDVDSMELIYD